jgi:predicted amidohydrolase
MVSTLSTRAPRTPPRGTPRGVRTLAYHAAMTLSVALVQLDARDDVEANIAAAVGLADDAARGGARFVALPEYLQYRGSDGGFRDSARPIPGPHTEPFSEVARRHEAWILVGSTAEVSPDQTGPTTPRR